MWLQLVTSKLKLSLTSRLLAEMLLLLCEVQNKRANTGKNLLSGLAFFGTVLTEQGISHSGISHQERAVKLQLQTSAKSSENKTRILKS